MICRNCGSEIGQGETFCRHCAYSCKHDSSTISVKVSVSGNSSAITCIMCESCLHE